MAQPRTMKAVVWSVNTDGEPLLNLSSVPVPKPLEKSDVLVRVCACAITSTDFELVSGDLSLPKVTPPRIPGTQFSGVVEAVGSGVTRLKPGDFVAGLSAADWPHGVLAEYSLQPEYSLILVPNGVSFAHAAAAVSPGLRALSSLFTNTNLQRGETIAVVGPGSDFGLAVIQAAVSLPCTLPVLAVPLSDEEAAFLNQVFPKSTYADRVRIVDPIKTLDHPLNDLRQILFSHSRSAGFDVIVSATSPTPSPALGLVYELVASLAPMGRLLLASGDEGVDIGPDVVRLAYLKGCSIGFSFDQVWPMTFVQQGRYLQILNEVFARVADGRYRIQIGKKATLEQAGEIFENEGFFGSGVIEVSGSVPPRS